MKQIALFIFVICLLTLAAFGQTAVKITAESEKQAILKVLDEYQKAMQQNQPERDKVRGRLLTEDYFYMGVDGLPAGKKFVMERQKNNGLQLSSFKATEINVRLYKNTAIVTMRMESAGVDKGTQFGGSPNGMTTVLVKQKGFWRIAADIIGREIEN